jgi:hypothetical protein
MQISSRAPEKSFVASLLDTIDEINGKRFVVGKLLFGRRVLGNRERQRKTIILKIRS